MFGGTALVGLHLDSIDLVDREVLPYHEDVVAILKYIAHIVYVCQNVAPGAGKNETLNALNYGLSEIALCIHSRYLAARDLSRLLYVSGGYRGLQAFRLPRCVLPVARQADMLKMSNIKRSTRRRAGRRRQPTSATTGASATRRRPATRTSSEALPLKRNSEAISG